jgi:hypothetical protein
MSPRLPGVTAIMPSGIIIACTRCGIIAGITFGAVLPR